ncbi:MAG: anaerobic ribonucleoside-triphosphate reductase activating protein [Oscillospiraceae bacterium]|nr:anaerobic ribonucleoside-triphosphate reductase activating protein [Oscillospiraceae bacterium]
MNYASIKKCDIANGTGVRVSLFVSGCTHHCQGCFNKETWDFGYGSEYSEKTQQEIIEALKPAHISGLTLIGGEPMEPSNQRVLVNLVKQVKQIYPNKNIWCYTGYNFENDLLKDSRARCEVTDELLSYIDIIVDGRFEAEKRNLMLKFRGSENQRIILVQQSLKSGKTILSELNK